MNFKQGDRVILTSEGEYHYSFQSKGSVGTVIDSNEFDPTWIDVLWDNGYSNNYEHKDIELA